MQVFTTTDCWVLFSIGFGKKGSTLKRIISSCDILNHAIVTKDELETSLNKLYQNDYIGFDEDKFYATKKAKSFYRKNKRASEGCIVEWIRISEVFINLSVKPGEINTIKITDEEYKKALNAHLRDFEKIFKELNIIGN